MALKRILLGLITISSLSLQAQQSDIWEDFKNAKSKGTTPILPDFSYAGYRYSEEAIPTVNYTVFDVTRFGAVPNDNLSDKKAFMSAIAAAEKNGEGIIYFPKGRYLFNTASDDQQVIRISGSKIVLRGEGSGKNGTVLFFDKDLAPADPKKMWSVPMAINIGAKGANKKLAEVTADAPRESHLIEVNNASEIKAGDWIILEVTNNSPELIDYDLRGIKPDPTWASIIKKGVQVNERHQVAKVSGNTLTLVEPIHYDVQAKHGWSVSSFAHLSEVGVENIAFEGNWLKKFVHHRSAQDDSGWSILSLNKSVNSWVRNCSFRNVNNGLTIGASAACSAIDLVFDGNMGHNSVDAAGGSTGILLANITDLTGMHHAVGVGGGSTTATVIWRSRYPENTCFESHSSQPRCTLLDQVTGGLSDGRAGGAIFNMPNHGRNLVLWNYNQLGAARKDFEFWPAKSIWWKIVPPIIVGYHGAQTTFNKDQVQVLESLGKAVQPESLFEAQLQLRLGKLPEWITAEKKKISNSNVLAD